MKMIGISRIVCASVLAVASVAHAQVNITTWQANNLHTGANLNETILTPALVSSPGNFGLLFSQPLDGQCYTQPLYVSGLTGIAGGTHNVVYVETQHNTIYAFDADNNTGGNANPLWSRSFLSAGKISVPQSEVGSGDISVELGNTATPVIDLATSTIYCLSKVKVTATSTYQQHLHALDLRTGAEKFGGPVLINPTFAGSANDGTGGVIPFNPLRSHARAALTLHNGVVYIMYASHSDTQPYHGEVIGYNAATLQWLPAKTWIATPNSGLAGIWQGGASAAVDPQGNMYVITGNGDWDQNSSPYTTGTNWGQSFIKLPTTGTFNVAFSNPNNWFTPNNWPTLNFGDADLGASGVLILPDQAGPHPRLLVGGGKGGQLYVLDRDAMGGHNTPNNSVQEITETNGLFVTPSYFNGNIYYAPAGGKLIQRAVGYNSLDGSYLSAAVKSNFTYNGGHGAGAFITANGATNGIAWILDLGNPAKLHAYNAANVAGDPIYSGTATLPGNINVKGPTFGLPTAANGKVYFAGYNTTTNTGYLTVWGQPAPVAGTPATPTNVKVTPVASSQATITWTDTANNESGFKIRRSTALNGTYTTLVPTPSTGANVTSFTDTGLNPSTTYFYQVVATNANGDSTPSVVASGTTFPTYSETGLVAYWNLDEISGGVSTDITGNLHTGTWEGEQAADIGYFNGGHWYHGTGAIASRISVANKADIQFAANQSFTLSAWVKPSALRSSAEAVIAKSRDNGNYYGIWINAANQWAARGPGGDVTGPAVVQDVWTHVTVVQDGAANTRKLYVNGTLANTGVAQAANGSGALWMGQANSGGGAVIEAFPGYIDEVRIYNRALAATEITGLLGAPVLQAASSKVQGTAGTFDLVLAPALTKVIESRRASNGAFSIVLNFSAPVAGVAATLSLQGGGAAVGTVGAATYDSSAKIVTIPLTNVGNAQKLNLRLTGIKRAGSPSDFPGTADVVFNVLAGDINKDNVVSGLDYTIVTNSHAAAVVNNTFFYDINCDGAVDAADDALVSAGNGTNIGAQTDSNLALFRPAVASSTNGAAVAGNAFDGKGTNQTRWESLSADPQWIYVNLGSVSTIRQLVVNWEAAAGKTYTFEVSNNGTTWSSPIATETNNTGAGIKTYTPTGGFATGQYLRLSGTTRTTTYGYSPWEIEVIGVPGGGGGATPVITSALTKSGVVGTALTYNITANNAPTSYSASPLPPGLSINTTTGAITGTPTTAGTTNTTITASNSTGTDTEVLVFTITGGGAAPVINSALTKTGTVGTALTYNITATNTPTSYGATPLPPGLAINTTTGAITGTPTATGTTNTTISATNASGTGTATLVFTISASGAPVINSALTKAGTVGTALTYNITATNTPTSYNATPLPAGLAINTTTGAITGTPTAAGTTNTTISATNASGTGTATLVFTISAAGSNLALGKNAVGSSTEFGVATNVTDGNAADPSRWASVYAGDPLVADVQSIYVDLGTPTTINKVTLRWEAAYGAAYKIQTSNTANGTDWVDRASLTAQNGGQDDITFAAVSARYVRMLGVTRGTIWGYSLYEFEIYNTGGGGSAPVINSTLTKAGTVGTALTYNITATNTPTSYNAAPLPPGLAINTTTGAITGTPTAAGTTNTTISATNASGTGSATLVFTISASGDTNLAQGQPATASSFQVGNVVANGNDASLTSRWAAVDGTFPQWWRVDLGSSKVLSRVDIMWLNPTTRAYKYRIETSPNDVTYTTAFDNTGNTTIGDTSNAITATARYVRITVTGSTTGGFASFFDIKVFGH